jgi:hypothetical protein
VIRIQPFGAVSAYVYSIQNDEYFFSNIFEKVRAGRYTIKVRNVETGCVASQFLDFPVSRFEAARGLDVRVYPNPGTGVYEVRLNRPVKAHYTVLDATGKTVASGEWAGESPHTLDITGVPAGVYLLRMNAGEAVYEQKLVKQ